jgi:excisionase family DNA binding protein
VNANVTLPEEFVQQVAARAAELLDAREADPWMDVDEAAAHLRCGRQRIYDLVSQERLVPGRDGRRLLFRRSELDRYLETSG